MWFNAPKTARVTLVPGGGNAPLLPDPVPQRAQERQHVDPRFVGVEDHGVRRRVHDGVNDRPLLGGFVGIDLVGHGQAGTAPAQAEAMERPADGRFPQLDAEVADQGQDHHAHRPERRPVAVGSGIGGDQATDDRVDRLTRLTWTATPRLIVEARRAVAVKPAQPVAHRGPPDCEQAGKLGDGMVIGRQQDHVGALAHPSHLLAHHPSQLLAFVHGWLTDINHGPPPLLGCCNGSARNFLRPT